MVWSGEELGEVIRTLELYIGFANAFQAALVVREVLDARDNRMSEAGMATAGSNRQRYQFGRGDEWR